MTVMPLSDSFTLIFLLVHKAFINSHAFELPHSVGIIENHDAADTQDVTSTGCHSRRRTSIDIKIDAADAQDVISLIWISQIFQRMIWPFRNSERNIIVPLHCEGCEHASFPERPEHRMDNIRRIEFMVWKGKAAAERVANSHGTIAWWRQTLALSKYRRACDGAHKRHEIPHRIPPTPNRIHWPDPHDIVMRYCPHMLTLPLKQTSLHSILRREARSIKPSLSNHIWNAFLPSLFYYRKGWHLKSVSYQNWQGYIGNEHQGCRCKEAHDTLPFKILLKTKLYREALRLACLPESHPTFEMIWNSTKVCQKTQIALTRDPARIGAKCKNWRKYIW